MKPQSVSSESNQPPEPVVCQPTPEWENYIRLAHKLARTGWEKLKSRGIPVDYEDVFQEVSLSWVKAAQYFDRQRGFKFSTYFVRAATLNFNRWAAQVYGTKENVKLISIDQPVGDDEECTLADVIADENAVNPEKRLSEQSVRARLEKKLPKPALRVIEILENPPPELLAEVEKMQAWSVFARKRGLSDKRPHKELNLNVILNLSNVSRLERATVYRALKSLL